MLLQGEDYDLKERVNAMISRDCKESAALSCSVPISDLHLLLCGFDEASECSVLLPFV